MIEIGRENKEKAGGFTLIEIIIALTLAGILAAMITVYAGNSLSRSGAIGENLRDTLKIYSIMERVRVHYDNDPNLDLDELKTNIDSNDYDYTIGVSNVVYNDYVKCDDPTSDTNFVSDSGCTIGSGNCMLLVTLSDPDQTGIKVSSLFIE